MGKLTALQVSKLTRRGLYGDGGGLYLQITKAGIKSWVFRFRVGKKLRNHGLGPLHTVSLAEARDAALQCRKLRLEGLDPIESRKDERMALKLEAVKSISFKACAEQYIEAHKAEWKNEKHAWQWSNGLQKHIYPVFGDVAVGKVNKHLVLEALEPIWHSMTTTAARLRGRIERILDWAKFRGYREGENPAAWKGNLEHTLPAPKKISKTKHLPSLPYKEIQRFWQKLSERPDAASPLLKFTILTAVRTNESLYGKWDEIDFENAMWIIPGERMKMSVEHRVPLSPPALAILKEQLEKRSCDYIFPGAKEGEPFSNMAMLMLARRIEGKQIPVHGFRATFGDWTAECTDAPREVADQALAHQLKNKVQAAYFRSDLFERRKKLMNEWAVYIQK
jgi:integrase